MRIKIRADGHALRIVPALLAILLPSVGLHSEESRLSSPGEYRGYSSPAYSESVRTSQYVEVRDGTKLAVDTFRPARNGKAVEDALPVIWAHDRYHRANLINGEVQSQLSQEPWLQAVVKSGYVVGVVDVRGSGASFGAWHGSLTNREALDAYDITEWFASQPWCSGRVGMFGRSYLGMAQFAAAGTAPPSLKAVFPEMTMSDLYSQAYEGGVFRLDWATKHGRLLRALDVTKPAAPVDTDEGGKLLARAIKEHHANTDVLETLAQLQYRDSKDKRTNVSPYLNWSISGFVDGVKKSGVAVYQMAGWSDAFTRDALLWYNNLDNPQKIIIGPWHHTDSSGFDLAAEHLRWYDYWLKGVNNGIRSEAPIYYYTLDAPAGKEWQSAHKWPLPDQQPTRFYLGDGPSGSISSVNDGLLDLGRPEAADARDEYTVDYSTTSGTTTRWANVYGGPFGYQNMQSNDQKGLTYTSTPLASDIQITGHPILHLWVSSTSEDGDFFAYLEEVNANGYSRYVTEGALKASHRAIAEAPINYIGLPYHRSYEKDVARLPQEPVELVFDLQPISKIFRGGQRIRLTITAADKDNALTVVVNPAPVITLYRNTKLASYIELPIIPGGENDGAIVKAAPVEESSHSVWTGLVILAVASIIGAALIVLWSWKRRESGRNLKSHQARIPKV